MKQETSAMMPSRLTALSFAPGASSHSGSSHMNSSHHLDSHPMSPLTPAHKLKSCSDGEKDSEDNVRLFHAI
jgi:hypothetical protein